MNKELALEIIRGMRESDEELSPIEAEIMLVNYHNGFGSLTIEQYEAVFWASTQGKSEPRPNPKKEDRKNGQVLRKKRTGSRRG